MKGVPIMNEHGWVRRSTGSQDCIEAFFYGAAFAPHRHDTYTLAMTTRGVQCFNYRGELRYSEPGTVVVLHPDELHDGQAGTEAGFGYRSVRVAPAEIQNALCGSPLPFVETGLSNSRRLAQTLTTLLSDLEHPLDQDERDDAMIELASELDRLCGHRSTSRQMDYRAVKKAKLYIDEHILEGFSLTALEREIDQSRWQLSKDFRSLLGTSPYRYLVMRRLDRARELLLRGKSFAAAAQACSFSDQSHFNRHFKKSYGMSPKAWLSSMRLS